jgi:hypothetical protein
MNPNAIIPLGVLPSAITLLATDEGRHYLPKHVLLTERPDENGYWQMQAPVKTMAD